ncbi:mas-related G-protein coupled receptor member H-like [Hemicordylus capensis]|uniref:mas-related G-protein coupled receptor member H-like n=1 Tax=Hemicordylus capensis TaxID=884348 RepID=UPI00230495CD|nr:mas-related G-protein coupled receptor member H-like [Hemicordylus capensis]
MDIHLNYSDFSTGIKNMSFPFQMDYTVPLLEENYEYSYFKFYELIILNIVIAVCMFGWVENSYVIWLLSFCNKANPFRVYFLNLAIADLGMLMLLPFTFTLFVVKSFSGLSRHIQNLNITLHYVFCLAYAASFCFLTIISMERCLSVLSPLCYQSHRPRCLSSRLTFLIWTLCAFFYGMQISFYLVYEFSFSPVDKILFIVIFWILPSLTVVFTVILLAKICCNSQRQLSGNLNSVVLLLPFVTIVHSLLVIIGSRYYRKYFDIIFVLFNLASSISSSIKPIVYYLVAKRWRCCSMEPLKVALQRLFQDEADSVETYELTNMNTDGEEACCISTTCSPERTPHP